MLQLDAEEIVGDGLQPVEREGRAQDVAAEVLESARSALAALDHQHTGDSP